VVLRLLRGLALQCPQGCDGDLVTFLIYRSIHVLGSIGTLPKSKRKRPIESAFFDR
jgi:hypothetical protein